MTTHTLPPDVIAGLSSDAHIAQSLAAVWPVVAQVLEAFSKNIELPIFAFINKDLVFQSADSAFPPFCSELLANSEFRKDCVADMSGRPLTDDLGVATHVCHAGLIKLVQTIELPAIGQLVLYFGGQRSSSEKGASNSRTFLERVRRNDRELGETLAGLFADSPGEDFSAVARESAEALAGAINSILGELLRLHRQASNVAHEVAHLMLGAGLGAQNLRRELEELSGSNRDLYERLPALTASAEGLLAESSVGLSIIQNLLSYLSAERLDAVSSPRWTSVDLDRLVRELVDLYRIVAARRQIQINLELESTLPPVRGIEAELRRAFHNVMSNAIKYSYRSTDYQVREVRVWAKVPYDPGFGKRRFALAVENFGLGLTPDECQRVGQPGFRGEQARFEVPMGSGLGLFEVNKILRAHGGSSKIVSKQLHEDDDGQATYLTEVDLIFPLHL